MAQLSLPMSSVETEKVSALNQRVYTDDHMPSLLDYCTTCQYMHGVDIATGSSKI